MTPFQSNWAAWDSNTKGKQTDKTDKRAFVGSVSSSTVGIENPEWMFSDAELVTAAQYWAVLEIESAWNSLSESEILLVPDKALAWLKTMPTDTLDQIRAWKERYLKTIADAKEAQK